MAGFMIGSLILNWVLCSALNGYIEQLAVEGSLRRQYAFFGMVAGTLVCGGLVIALALLGFPESEIATQHMTPDLAASTAYSAAALNGLFVMLFCGHQLRRYWD